MFVNKYAMEDELFNVPLQDVKREIRHGIIECQKRGLLQSAKWLSEMNHGLAFVDIDLPADSDTTNLISEAAYEGIDRAEYDNYFLAKSYFDVQEYDRAAYFVRNCESPVPRFLHYYSMYMARDKRQLDSTTDQSNLNESASHVRDLAELLSTLRSEYSHSKLDGYGMYLYGIVLKTLNLNDAAIQVLEHSIRLAPMLWCSYVELAPLITEKSKLLRLSFGGHWMRFFFVAHTYIELYLSDEGLKAYEELQTSGFKKCVYVTSQMALAYHNKRDVDKAIEIFQTLQAADPYRLDNLDIYSNLLFVKELKTEMAQLAHKAVSINKYRAETCCIIGNYYSIRCDHQMAISYFQRALKLNPKYLAAWTLMGHEFMELKNTNAAIQSYRKAVEVNKRDYRAWYGLGQSYEILKMHYYSLYYFKIAHKLRPYDSRMLVALGETYEKLEKNENSIKCYKKACDVGDIEGIAMYKLASLHERLDQLQEAVHYYGLYCEDERAAADKQSLYHGFMTLANYYEGISEYDRASHYAYKCLESDDRKSEAKSLLKTIENKRIGTTAIPNDIAEASTSNSCSTSNVVNYAENSSDDDMELELSEYKYINNDYMMHNESLRETAPLPSVNVDTSSQPNISGDSMNISESEMLNVSIPSTPLRNIQQLPNPNKPTSSSRVATDDNEEDINDANSMEISSISID